MPRYRYTVEISRDFSIPDAIFRAIPNPLSADATWEAGTFDAGHGQHILLASFSRKAAAGNYLAAVAGVLRDAVDLFPAGVIVRDTHLGRRLAVASATDIAIARERLAAQEA